MKSLNIIFPYFYKSITLISNNCPDYIYTIGCQCGSGVRDKVVHKIPELEKKPKHNKTIKKSQNTIKRQKMNTRS